MARPSKSAGKNAHIIGRDGFSKISAIEGIKLSTRVEEDFREFDRKGLSAPERRKAIARKYGAKA